MDSIVVAGNDQVTTDLDGETIGLQMANGIYFNLNPVGTSVWKLIQEPRKVRRIYEELIKEYTVQPEICLLSCSNSRKRNWSLSNHEGGCPKGRRHSRVCLAASVG